MSQEVKDLKYFLNPRSIAVIGASNKFDSISGKPIRFLREHEYEGEVYPINPKYDELKGYKCYKSVLDVPGEVDLAMIAINYKLVLPMLEQCVEKGVKFASIFASGFAESGEEGRLMQKKIGELAKSSGMGICGPNCQGSVALKTRAIGGFSASLGVKPLIAGPIGYVTQSGALGYSIFSLAQEAGVGFSYVASTGNEVDLHTLDFLEFMQEDEETKMTIAYLEGIKNGKQFIRLANRGLELNKPIVALKVGRSEVGQKAAASHTASLTGSDAVSDAFFRQKAIIRAEDVQDMIDIAALMQRIPALPKGKGLGIITTSGGGGILAADVASDLGLDIPELGEKTTEYIEKYIPAYGSALNPVDVTAQVINEAEDFQNVLQALVDHDDIDALVLVITQITGDSGRQMAEDIVKMSKKTDKPMVVSWTTGDVLVGDQLKILDEGGVQFYKSPARATIAMGRLMKYGAERDELVSRMKSTAKDAASGSKDKALAILGQADKALTEHQGKELLSLYDIPVTKEDVATSEKHALEIIESVGYPAALKIDSPDIQHKTEAGGLKLNITNKDELITAYNEVMDNCRKYDPKAKLNGVLIQEMVMGGEEVIVGVNNDPQFGPTIMFGLGGIFVEILKDVALRVAPIAREDAMDMIKEIKGYKVLAGARGRAKADIDAIADVLVKVSKMAVELEDQVAELDINPLLALPEGKGVRVADALIIKK
ncbi:MAG: acetate--CoA ligase family protein [Deltaproteobacteria bacterium]|nr:acetate--CoA ligase family protein [Deltaproteobacteria bacterium]